LSNLGKVSGLGFTLLEVMVALAILAMSLAAITFANNTSMLQLAATNRMIEASFLLEAALQSSLHRACRSWPWRHG